MIFSDTFSLSLARLNADIVCSIFLVLIYLCFGIVCLTKCRLPKFCRLRCRRKVDGIAERSNDKCISFVAKNNETFSLQCGGCSMLSVEARVKKKSVLNPNKLFVVKSKVDLCRAKAAQKRNRYSFKKKE